MVVQTGIPISKRISGPIMQNPSHVGDSIVLGTLSSQRFNREVIKQGTCLCSQTSSLQTL